MPGFNSLDASSTRQQFALLGGLPAQVVKAGNPSIDTKILIDRDIEVVIDNGMAVTKRTVISFIRADVGKIAWQDRVIVHPEDPDLIERFEIADIISDDGVVVRGYVRG